MIALILGTSEGRKILSLLNEFTEDICITTATDYGGELLKSYKYKNLNTKPLDGEALTQWLKENGAKVLIDASHPYALEISKTAQQVCNHMNIEYIRYERPSIYEKYKNEKLVIEVTSYEELGSKLKNVEGTLLNTTGSRNIKKILDLSLSNRIVHRVLPSLKVMEECFALNVRVEDLIAIKGPIGYSLNKAFIEEYEAKGIILKDSGLEGGTEEKIRAAIDSKIPVYIITRQINSYDGVVFEDINALIDYLNNKYLKRSF
ncbi:cobalt-precorrin-6A reductase [Desnuesiella massiliensis]|uniref:cobalt-precorrin-6A reductase n=1 Tax=Desnuesiella massiliensis TaxID=1650662 RepID=UPI0006E24B47|nr:cobalt-precorrin-6A reductase [Desnuesiella massiliensis]